MRFYRRKKRNGTWVWWASWTEDSVTVRRSTRCSDRDAAELVGKRWERERADPELAAARQATLESECDIFLRECRAADLADGTLSMYEQKLANVCDVIGRTTPLANITATEVDRYFTIRDDEGASDSTQYKEWVALSGVLKSAKHRGRFPRDVASLKPPRLSPSYVPRVTWLTWDQGDKLLAELEGDRRRIVAYVLATGARRGEAARAKPGDVLRRGANREVVIHGTKTEDAAATIPIPKPMRRWLAIAGNPPFAPWVNARRGLAAACVRAGIPVVTWNDLRRTNLSLLAQAGVPTHLLRHLSRHRTTAMLDRVYARQTPAALAVLIDRTLRSTRSPSVTQRKPKVAKRSPRGRKRKH